MYPGDDPRLQEISIALDVIELELLTDSKVPACVLERYTHGTLLSAFLRSDPDLCDLPTPDPIAIHADALSYYVDVLQMLRKTDEAAVVARREAWRDELARLRARVDAAADARGEWRCDDCGHRTDMWSHGDAQWLQGSWSCDVCYEQRTCSDIQALPPSSPSQCASDDTDGNDDGCPRYVSYDMMARDPSWRSHPLYHQACMDQREAETGARPGTLLNPHRGPGILYRINRGLFRVWPGSAPFFINPRERPCELCEVRMGPHATTCPCVNLESVEEWREHPAW